MSCRIRPATDRTLSTSITRNLFRRSNSFSPELRPEDLPDGEAWAIERIAGSLRARPHISIAIFPTCRPDS